MWLNQLGLGALSNEILQEVNKFAAGRCDGIAVNFRPNDPELAAKIDKYRQYSLAFEMVDELQNALASNGMQVNPFVQELLLNLITMANNDKVWTSAATRLEFIFTATVGRVSKSVDVKASFVYDDLILFEMSHNFAIKAIRPK